MKKKEYLMTENVGSICIHTTEMNSICDFWKESEDRSEPFRLSEIALDAFNTANKCGLLPSELLRQNQKLLSALKDLVVYCRGNMTNQLEPLISKANYTIDKIQNN